jgi:hypothetical protein
LLFDAAAAAAAAQVKELLAPYGLLKSFNLVMDKNTGKSKVRRVCNISYSVLDV